MKHAIIIVCMFLTIQFITACQNTKPLSKAQKIDASCLTVATSLDALTVANNAHKLTSTEQSAILDALNVVTPICAAPQRPTLSEAETDAFTGALSTIAAEAAKYSTTAGK